MASIESPVRHIPSVSELQAALLAARNGKFASPRAGLVAEPPPRARCDRGPIAPVCEPPLAAAGAVWLLGTHGGSGARCLSAALPGTRYSGRQWPVSTGSREPVVLVCRGNHRGLTSAQECARAYRDGDFAAKSQLLGLIVSADAPGRSPVPLRRLERLLCGAVPVLAHVPWEPRWRLGPATGQTQPLSWVARVAEAISVAVRAG